MKEREAAQPDTMSLEDRIIASLQKTLKKPAEGEERLQGVLTHIECVPKSIIYTIKAGDRVLRLRSDSFNSVDMIAYTDEVKTQINCGPRKPESPLVVIYRPVPDARRKLDGVAVSFEFVPRKFQLK